MESVTTVTAPSALTTLSPFAFFQKNYKDDITVNQLKNITTVKTCGNIKLPVGVFNKTVSLRILTISHNAFLTSLEPNLFVNTVNLTYLNLSHNKLEKLDPRLFEKTVNLTTLDVSHNNLTELPIEIMKLTKLKEVIFHHNPIEDMHPVLERFVDWLEVQSTGRVKSTSEIHTIKYSVRNAVIDIIKENKLCNFKDSDDITKDKDLTKNSKKIMLKYLQGKTMHSSLFITFEELLKYGWNRIDKRIFNDAIEYLEKECFEQVFIMIARLMIFQTEKQSVSDEPLIPYESSIPTEQLVPTEPPKSKLDELMSIYLEKTVKKLLQEIKEKNMSEEEIARLLCN